MQLKLAEGVFYCNSNALLLLEFQCCYCFLFVSLVNLGGKKGTEKEIFETKYLSLTSSETSLLMFWGPPPEFRMG